jgi:hypothetical protein
MLFRFREARRLLESIDRGRLYEFVSVAVLLAAFFLLSLASVRYKSITVDEAKHYEYGQRILNLQSDRLNSGGTIVDDSKMPFTALNALPAKMTPYLPEGWLKRFSVTLQAGRPVTILFSVLMAFFLYRWAKQLYGVGPALFSLLLYVLEPSIIAHSHFVATDIYAMGMMMLTVYALWHFNQRPSFGRLVLVSAMLGLSQVAKYTNVFLVPLLVATQLAHDLPSILTWIRDRNRPALQTYVRKWILGSLLVGASGLAIVNAAYFSNRTMTPLGEFGFKSGLFRAVQARLDWLGWFPIPLPYPYLQGLDLVNYRDQLGFGFGKIFLLGHLSPNGFPGYYWIDMALKTPLPTLLAIILGVVLLAWKHSNRDHLFKHEIFLLIPVIWFLIYMNYILHAQLGIRLMLVIYPFLFILAGNLIRGLTPDSRVRLGIVAALTLWLGWSVLSFYPHFLPYSSELIWDKRKAYSYLANGEFDWGQSRRYLDDWLEAHPEAIIDPVEPVSGTIVATPKLLVGTPRYQSPEKYAWLRDHFEPVDVIAFTYPVFYVSPDELARLSGTRLEP